MKPDVLIFVEAPGRIEFERGAWTYQGRRLRYEIGAHKTHELDELARLLDPYDRRVQPTIDPYKGVTVQETIQVMEVAGRLGFQVFFSGTPELD